MPRLARAIVRPEVLFFAGLMIFFLHGQRTATFPLVHGDGHYTYMWARSLAYDHDLKLDNDYALCGDPWGKLTPVAPGLGPKNTWSPGPALVWTPLLWAGRALNPSAAHSADPQIAGACHGPIADVAMAGSAAMVVLALVLGFVCARRYVGRGAALFGAASVGLASPVFFYATYAPSYGHAASAFAVALFVERWDALRGQRTAAKWGGLGLALGAAMLIRPQTVIIALPAAVEWVLAARRDVRARTWGSLRTHVVHGVFFAAMALLLLAPQLYAWKITYGQYFVIPMGPQYMRWGDPKIAATLFSMLGGLLPFSPILYASFAGVLIGLGSRKTRMMAAAMATLLGLELYVNASVWDFWGSAGFPARRFTEMALPFAFGASLFAEAFAKVVRRRPERAAHLALGACVLFGAIWSENVVHPDHEGRSDEIFAASFKDGMRWVRDTVGDPVAWPASIPFAIRYRCHPRRYDRMTGFTAFYEDWDNQHVLHDTVSTTSADDEDFLVDDFAPKAAPYAGEAARVTTGPAPRLLIPAFRGSFDRVQIRWASIEREPVAVTVRWNGKKTPAQMVGTLWETTEISLPAGAARSGINEVVLEIPKGAIAIVSLRVVQAQQGP